ncbi:MAG: zinc-dependent alcohol dehydrogenase family protein [Acidobacteriota bacterium]
MRAVVFEGTARCLRLADLPEPSAGPGQVLVDVVACAVCRTDLHIVDGELPHAKLPLVPGHEIAGTVREVGDGVTHLRRGDQVGIPWLGFTCGACPACRSGRENLCPSARFTGFDIDGGYAETCVADARYTLKLPSAYSDVEAAPLLCAGLIGYRAYLLAGAAPLLGIYGFGAAAHLLCQLATADGRAIFAFTRPGDDAAQAQARRLGAVWAGGSDEMPPRPLDGAIIFAPAGPLVPAALAAVAPGATVVCGGIHMSDIPSFPYRLLWGERVLRSVANLTRADGEAFMAAATRTRLSVETTTYPLASAVEALDALRAGRILGAAVLTMGGTGQGAADRRA